MKKIVITIIIACLLLTSCANLINKDNNTTKAEESTLASTSIVDDTNNPLDDNQGKEDKLPDNDNTNSQTKLDISDYIMGLADTEYANDPAFLSFVANMDERAVGKIIYASPDGDGEGTIDDPALLEDAIDMAKAGDTVYLRGGEYIFKEAIWIDKKGNANAYITIKCYPGEKAILTTTPENVNKYDENGEYIFFGFDEGSSYIIFENLEIYGVTDKYVAAFACYDGGQNHLIFKNIDIHDLKTSQTEYGCNAFLFMGEKKAPINNIMLINNTCHDLTLGYSEAISFAGNCEYCYVIDNEVYNCTNIGIDFYGNAEYCSVESLDQARYCVAAYNTVYNCNSPYADCAGIYVDGGRNCLIEGNLVYKCQYGIEIGSEELNEKYPVTDIVVRNNILAENTVCTIRIGGYDTKTSGTVKNSVFYNNTFVNNTGDSDIIISKVDSIVIANNFFVGNIPYVETEFSSTYIKNLEFYNNCFNRDGEHISIYDNEITVDELNNLYGNDNFVYNVTLDSNYAPDKNFVGHEDYAPAYDFHLVIRENQCIGAVEK